jgi:MFS superfamily sulfate permease-like transporter
MKKNAILLSGVIAIGAMLVTSFETGIGIGVICAIVFHIKPELMGRLNKDDHDFD